MTYSQKDLHHERPPDYFQGAVAGAVGGFAGACLMNAVHHVVARLVPGSGDENKGGAAVSAGESGEAKLQPVEAQREAATVAADASFSSGVFRNELTEQQKKLTGPLIHYAYGALMGAVYGVLAEAFPRMQTGGGTAFGAGLWLVGDEVAVPVLSLAPGPAQVPASTHASALVAHLVYGCTTEAVRRGISTVWDSNRVR